jgi:hypothetical protein
MPSNINSGLATLNSSRTFGLNCNRTTKSVASTTLSVYAVWGLGGLVCGVVKGEVVAEC